MIKKIFIFISLIFTTGFLFAQNTFSLMDKSKEKGITFYWDSLSETGMLEKNGHQVTFRKNEQIVILDSVRMSITDAPELKDNKVYVSQKFLNDTDVLFQEDNSTKYKVGAILIDAGHGGKDPGALKTYKINGKKKQENIFLILLLMTIFL